ncbi:MAG: hypothetical protein RMM58_03330 [Chloroflexota bacterium]|nr:hypothetical protein [Dehalococcoidia bacterium]MDW8252891.1 hypothetical protein [Chloroflexota bacterium]
MRRRLMLALALGALLALLSPVHPLQEAAAEDCAGTNAVAYQPTHAEAQVAMLRAAAGTLGPSYPRLPRLLSGYPETTIVTGTVPCVLPQAIGWVESGWRQASGVARGSVGPVLTGRGGCGVGVMQTSTGMRYAGELPRPVQLAIASNYIYNIAYGVQILGQKWNATPPIGNADPTIAEHWYYAVWAYNSWSWRNNPNNPDFPWPRPPYTGTQPVSHYPYQELVFGLAANPPRVNGAPLWQAVPLSLPDAGAIGISPDAIPEPRVVHRAFCLAPDPYLPSIPDRSGLDWR